MFFFIYVIFLLVDNSSTNILTGVAYTWQTIHVSKLFTECIGCAIIFTAIRRRRYWFNEKKNLAEIDDFRRVSRAPRLWNV